jgi:hypothetical protein
MRIHLFDLKREMERAGEMLIDFTENNFRVRFDSTDLVIRKIMLVEERHLGRIDLISYEMYGDINSIDILLKINQITNPFSMNVFDLMIIPDPDSAKAFYQKEKLTNIQSIKDTKALFIDPKRASQRDMARLKQLEQIANRRKNGAKEVKPTNLLRKGEVPFSTDGNRLLFAPAISKPRFPTSNDVTT